MIIIMTIFMLCTSICSLLYVFRHKDMYVYFAFFFLVLAVTISFRSDKDNTGVVSPIEKEEVLVTTKQFKLSKTQIVVFGDKDSVLYNTAYSPSGVKIERRHYDTNNMPDTIIITIY